MRPSQRTVFPVILTIVMLSGWTISYAAQVGDDGSAATPGQASADESAQLPGLASPAEAPLPLAESPLLGLETPLAFKAGGCHTENCGNTGQKTGQSVGPGASCTAALADLNSKIRAAADSICPGVVTGITRDFTINDCEPDGHCDWVIVGSADIECKVCPGLFCW